MTDTEILETFLLPDLEKMTVPESQRAFLLQLIASAKEQIAREGITLDLSEVDDCLTVSMYAAYLYRRRAVADNGMPRMLRYRLNNRLFAEKMKASENDG